MIRLIWIYAALMWLVFATSAYGQLIIDRVECDGMVMEPNTILLDPRPLGPMVFGVSVSGGGYFEIVLQGVVAHEISVDLTCFDGPRYTWVNVGRAADLDDDGDVDQVDFGLLQACIGGPDVPPRDTCIAADLDRDFDVDSDDVVAFEQYAKGPGVR